MASNSKVALPSKSDGFRQTLYRVLTIQLLALGFLAALQLLYH